MQIPNIVYLLGGFALVVFLGIVVLLVIQSRRVNLTKSDKPNEKPEWLRANPPKETMAATLADGEGITPYNYDEGERLA